MNWITATLRNGCFWKMDVLRVHTTLNHHPPIMNVLPNTFLQIILVAKWFYSAAIKYVPNHQRRPLNSLLYLSFFYGSISLFFVVRVYVYVQCVCRSRAVACARWASRRRLEQPSLPNFIVYFSLKAYYIPTHRRQGMTPRIPSSRTATQKKSGGKKKLCY